MPTIHVDPVSPGPQVLAHAASVLRRGGLVAFPTETVYGLGANALDSDAVARIFAAKGRPSFNPLIVHVADAIAARTLVTEWPEAAERLAAAFWPGPLTLVLPKQPRVSDLVTAGLPSVALRVPAHPVALALLRAAGIPVAAPSANRYTELSPTTAAHVERGLGDRVELILDAGPTRVGIESTVVDLTGERPVLLRPGIISADALERIVGPLGALRPADSPDAPRPAPGMVERHYAPRAGVVLFAPRNRATAAAEAHRLAGEGRRIGALLLAPFDAPVHHPLRMPADPAAYAQRLYASLHTLDAAECDVVFVEAVPETVAWEGVRDRLERASR